MRRVEWAIGLAAGLVALAAGAWYASGPRVAVPRADPAAFVGSDACAGCHATEYAAWRGSQHAGAMQHATEATVRGDFRDATFAYAGVASTFFRRDGRFFVRTDGPDGSPAEFEVTYTYGLEPLQQYLVELPGGRLQALSIAWDTRPAAQGGQRWFHLYPDEAVGAGDELHWTAPAQNWNFMCADCHSTNVRKGYDPSANAFATTWSELTVGCEACHGPGSAHVAWAATKPAADATKGLTVALDERRGLPWRIDAATGNARPRSGPRTDREIDVCAPCHARRAQIAEGYRAGRPFLDHYLPALLTPPQFHADGQQHGEVYTWASFLQSRMYQAGVTCSDCHEPHTLALRAEGNAVCAPCHAAEKYDARAHHFHDPVSPAGQCVSCHMPAATYMVVDPRHDHSLRVPRPDRSVALGVPNPCNGCHADRDARWAAAATRQWYGDEPSGLQTFAEAFHAAETGAPRAAAALAAIGADPGQPAIVRASAVERLAALGDPAAGPAVLAAAGDAMPLVRLAAARAADTLPPEARLAIAAPLLADPLRAVRIESARVLAPAAAALPAAQRAAWERAAADYLATLEYTADRPEARTALGSFYADLGRFDRAQAAFAAARGLDPTFVPAYANAADAYRAQGREADAERLLEAGLARVPDTAALHHALGLLHVRQQRSEAALRSLQRAAELAPEERRYGYVYAVALHSLGRTPEAIAVLERAATRWPGDREVLVALATIQRDAGRPDAARRAARALVDAHPDDPEARALLDSLR